MEILPRVCLGSGNKTWPGFLNVDLVGEPDVVSNVKDLIFEDHSVPEIHAIHLFEHIERWDVERTLLEWKRVLVPGGKLILELPCLDKIMDLYSKGERSQRLIQLGIFGEYDESCPYMQHRWCWSIEEITSVLDSCGFKNIEVVEPFFHVKARDMRVISTT